MAIDYNTISKTYYGGNAESTPAGIVNRDLKGYNFAYEEWPEGLKEEYSYNTIKAKEFLAEAGYPRWLHCAASRRVRNCRQYGRLNL